MDEDKHSPSEFYYPKNLETLDAETDTGILLSESEYHIPSEQFTDWALGPLVAALGPHCHELGPLFHTKIPTM